MQVLFVRQRVSIDHEKITTRSVQDKGCQKKFHSNTRNHFLSIFYCNNALDINTGIGLSLMILPLNHFRANKGLRLVLFIPGRLYI